MPTLHTLFVPKSEIPSAYLNGVQLWVLTQRASGAANTLAVGLNTAGAQNDARRIAAALDTPAAILAPLSVDEGFDWRDRVVDVGLFWDPARDIRPGQGNDDVTPMVISQVRLYTRLGGLPLTVSPHVSLLVDAATGALFVLKQAGYVFFEVQGGSQLKERS